MGNFVFVKMGFMMMGLAKNVKNANIHAIIVLVRGGVYHVYFQRTEQTQNLVNVRLDTKMKLNRDVPYYSPNVIWENFIIKINVLVIDYFNL